MIEVDWSGAKPKVKIITDRPKYFKELDLIKQRKLLQEIVGASTLTDIYDKIKEAKKYLEENNNEKI